MKSDEILQEGPLDWASRVGAGIKGAVTPGQTASGAYTVKAQQQNIDAIVKRHAARWYQIESDLAGNGVPKEEFGQYLTNWARQWYKLPSFPEFTGSYTQQAAAAYIARALRESNIAEFTPKQPAANQTSGNTKVNSGNVTVSSGNTKVQSSNVSPTGNATTAANTTVTSTTTADPAHAMFKDPASFKAEWDKFMSANPNFKLITDPELLSVLKNMWMRTGGTKTESKNNKGTRV